MERGIKDRTILEEFAEDFTKIVEKHCRYIIVSGFVAIAHGRSRGTEDIDMIIEKIDEKRFEELHNDLIEHGFECMQSENPQIIYMDYLLHKTSVRYTKKGEFLPEMEIKFVKDKLDEFQIQTRIKLPLTGLDVWFSSINMNIAFKEEYLKSEKDLKDAVHLRKVYPELVNEHEINNIKKLIKELKL